MKYQIVVNRQLSGYGQFVTEGRDEVNTTIINGEERPFIFASKLRAVERRTIMNKVREVLKNDCFLQTHEKSGDSGISGLCMSCPACWLFGGTYAPKTGNKTQVNERTKVNYSDAYPLKNVPIEDKTFNAVDEKTNTTGQALGINQIVGPGGNFINVVDIETNNEDWVKLVLWGIEHSNRYGGNVRIYGQMKNEILGIIKSDKLEITSWELVTKFNTIEAVKGHLGTFGDKIITFSGSDAVISQLNSSPEVQELKKRKSKADSEKIKKVKKGKKEAEENNEPEEEEQEQNETV